MSASNFLACFRETESFEGGFVNNPHDPGGATMKGVTQSVYAAWRTKNALADQSVRLATDVEIQAIYREQYWNAVNGDALFDGLDLVMVDCGWGSGPVTAIKWLQRILGVAVDGHLGVLTLAAMQSHYNSAELITTLCSARMIFFQSLNTWKYFGAGWTNRLNSIKTRALEMNEAARNGK